MRILYSDLDSAKKTETQNQNINNQNITATPIEKEQAMRKYFEVGDGQLTERELSQMMALYEQIAEVSPDGYKKITVSRSTYKYFKETRMITIVVFIMIMVYYIIEDIINSGLREIWY